MFRTQPGSQSQKTALEAVALTASPP